MTLFENYLEQLTAKYPSTRTLQNPQDLSNLVSAETIEIPSSVLQRVAELVRRIYQYAHSQDFLTSLEPRVSAEERSLLPLPMADSSVLMAYDFHYHPEDDQLSLIEINTNASNFLTSQLLYDVRSVENPWPDSDERLKSAFFSEWRAYEKSGQPCAAIIDENPKEQKMYVEFLMYKDLLNSWGWPTEIYDYRDLPQDGIDFVYNRHTDFLFNHSSALLARYRQQTTVFSPHPREYLLLASKDRLIDFSEINLSPYLIPTRLIKSYKHDELWKLRKQLFFKPRALFGGKAAYRGSSISKKTLKGIFNEDFIVQDFRPPGTYKDFKFDLRFFVYRDVVQLGCARIYRGQVTNMQTPGGGLALLRLKS